MSDQWFSHSGDIGDLLFAMPAIRAAGGGTLYVFDFPGRTTHGMSRERMELFRPLLLQQPYIEDVRFWEPHEKKDHNLNGFRDWMRGRNNAEAHCGTLGLLDNAAKHIASPWLQVDKPTPVAPVVFARTPRYRNDRFPWRRAYEKYGKEAVFLGLPSEHADFVKEFGPVPYQPTANLLEAARVIAGAKLFVGNQSSLHAIAEGMKKPLVLEVYPQCATAIFHRRDCLNVFDENCNLPERMPDGNFRFENREVWTPAGNGLGDHWGALNYLLRLSVERGETVFITSQPNDYEKERYRAGRPAKILEMLDSPGRVEIVDLGATRAVDGFGIWRGAYSPTKTRWAPNDSRVILYHAAPFTMRQSTPASDQLTRFLQGVADRGYKAVELTGDTPLEQVVNLLAGAAAVVSLSSGFSHIAHSVGAPLFLVQGPVECGCVTMHHIGKKYVLCVDFDDALNQFDLENKCK